MPVMTPLSSHSPQKSLPISFYYLWKNGITNQVALMAAVMHYLKSYQPHFFSGLSAGGGASWHARHPGFGQRYRLLLRSRQRFIYSKLSRTSYSYQAPYHWPSGFPPTMGKTPSHKKYLVQSSTPSINIQDVGTK